MSIDAMKQALEAFEWNYNTDLDNIPACEQWAKMLKTNIAALRAAIEKEKKRSKDHWCTSCNGVEPHNCKYNTRNV